MIIDKTIDKIRQGSENWLFSAARDLGHEYARQDLQKLRLFRAAAARIKPIDDYHAGFIAAMLEITAAYEAAIE